MEQENLFKSKVTDDTCKNCEHSQRWECNSKFFYYCGITASGRTDNGLKKIKLKDIACGKHESVEETK